VGKTTIQQVEEVLEKLPTGIDATYDQAIRRIEEQGEESSHLAKCALMWITFAEKSVTIGELAEALAIDTSQETLGPGTTPDASILLSISAGLIDIDVERGNIVRLVHSTAQSYLERTTLSTRELAGAHEFLAATCLSYFSYVAPCLMDTCSKVDTIENSFVNSALKCYPLLGYAAAYWDTHIQKIPRYSRKFEGLLLDFLVDKCARGKLALAFTAAIRDSRSVNGLWPSAEALIYILNNWKNGSYRQEGQGIAMAASLGLWKIMNIMVTGGGSDSFSEMRDAGLENAMAAVILKSPEHVVQMLLELDHAVTTKLINCLDKWHRTPLTIAAGMGNVPIVRRLLGHPGTDVNGQVVGKTAQNPLIWAVARGRLDIVRLLLAHQGIDVNFKASGNIGEHALLNLDRRYFIWDTTPLVQAIIAIMQQDPAGYESFRLLLGHPNIDVNLPGDDGDTPLIKAIFWNKTLGTRMLAAATQMFLDHPAIDVNSKGGTTAHHYVWQSPEDMYLWFRCYWAILT